MMTRARIMGVDYRLMNDYGVDWPLWRPDGLCREGDLDLTPGLADSVRAWAADFKASYSHETGWPDESSAERAHRQARRLVEVIERELPSQDSITLHFWESAFRR